ncbi:uncharacterized protein LOC120843301 [Ixodes scapularis]|uniref:uncharacterized protein LOC120843301 n=1 Tax=Ixodes scapularis TaxID=6945 RepID=UPI001A9DA41A|nr:uncharacterized protein LOC120843301 [Ixodes scapularis]
MAGQISTVLCIISAAILIPEVHSRAHQTNYDAAAEILIPKRYSMRYRSVLDDRMIPQARYCVSLLFTSVQFGRVEAIFRYKLTLQSEYTNKLVRLTTRKSTPRSIVDNMITTTEQATMRQLYDQKLEYSDRRTCRVLVQTFGGGTKVCSLWVAPEKRRGPVPRECSNAYSQICPGQPHQIDYPDNCA